MNTADTAALKEQLELEIDVAFEAFHNITSEQLTARLLPLVSRLIEAAEGKVLREVSKLPSPWRIQEKRSWPHPTEGYCCWCKMTTNTPHSEGEKHEPTCLWPRALAVSTPREKFVNPLTEARKQAEESLSVLRNAATRTEEV